MEKSVATGKFGCKRTNSESVAHHLKSSQPHSILSYDKENRMVVFYEGATLNTYTYDSGGFKKVENVSGNLSTIIWDGTDSL